MSREKS